MATKQTIKDGDYLFAGRSLTAAGGTLYENGAEVEKPEGFLAHEDKAMARTVGDAPLRVQGQVVQNAGGSAALFAPGSEKGRPDYSKVSDKELVAEAKRRKINVPGTGTGGEVLRDDLVAALAGQDAAEFEAKVAKDAK